MVLFLILHLMFFKLPSAPIFFSYLFPFFSLAGQQPSKLNCLLKLNFSLNTKKFLRLILSSYLALSCESLSKSLESLDGIERNCREEGKNTWYRLSNQGNSIFLVIEVFILLGQLLKSFTEPWHIQILHCPYHSQYSGKIERNNEILKLKLPKFFKTLKLLWPKVLPLALLIMRSTVSGA